MKTILGGTLSPGPHDGNTTTCSLLDVVCIIYESMVKRVDKMPPSKMNDNVLHFTEGH